MDKEPQPTPPELLQGYANIEDIKNLLVQYGIPEDHLFISKAKVPVSAKPEHGNFINALFLHGNPPLQLTYQIWHGTPGVGELKTHLGLNALQMLQDRGII